MRRNWLIAALVVGVAAVVLAAVAMRLSEDEPPTVAEWADSVCTSLGEWEEGLASLANLGGVQLSAELLEERLDEAEDATSELIAELRDLGAPDLDSGAELEEELDASVAELESSFDELKQGAEDAADAPASEFLQALAELASDFAALQTAIASTVTTLENANVAEESRAELEQAFADAPSCQSLDADS